MNWDAIGAIGEIIGAIAVVASLIYLSVQIRHNSRQIEEQVRALNADSLTAIENSFSKFRQSIINNSQMASLWRRGLECFNDLDDDEKCQISALFQEFCWAWENTFTRTTAGDYTSDGVDPFIKNLIHILNHPGAREWWSEGKREFSEEFVKLIDYRLGKSKSGASET